MKCKYKVKINDTCKYKVSIKDIQNKYKFKIFCSGGAGNLSNYYTKEEIDTKLNDYATKEYVNNLVGDIGSVIDAINGEVI